MKKILSIILAAVLVFSLLPTIAFATDTAADAGITITYDVTKNFGIWSSEKSPATVQFAEFTYESNNGFWEYYGNSKNLPTVDASKTLNWDGKGGMQMREGWWAIKIIVPKSGVYTPKVIYKEYHEAAMLNLYLVPKNGELSVSDLNDNNCIGSIDCYDPQYSTTPTLQDPKALAPRYIEAGEYYFVYSTGAKTSPGGTGWVFFNNLTLDGNGTDTVLSGISVPDKAWIKLGETKKLEPILYLNDGTVATGEYAVSYSSSDSDVVTVNADGTIVLKSEGDAVITTSTVNEAGYTISAETDVAVFYGATIKYDLVKHVITDLKYKEVKDGPCLSLAELTEDITDGFYSFFPGSGDVKSNDHDHSKVKYYSNIQLMYSGTKIAFKINVPAAGYYDIVHDVVNVTSSNKYANRRNVDVGVYISKNAINVSSAAKVGVVNSFSDDYEDGESRQITSGRVKFDEPGEYIITFRLDKNYTSRNDFYAGIYSFYLVGGNNSALMNGKISSTADEINVDEGETATVSATGFVSSTTEAATFTYSSSNKAVATVDANGVVTPVSAGKATITATANTDISNKLTKEITVTENKPGEAVATEVNVYVGATTGGTVTATGVTAGSIESVYAGKQISVTATAAEGYKFAYWKDSAGNHVSDSAKYNFKPYTNTSLIAVFDNAAGESEKIGVDFFDGNRAYLGFIEVVSGTAFGDIEDKPTYGMTGYKPMGWSISNDEKITSFVRAVALYEEETNPVSGITVNASGKNAHYGDEIETTVEGAKTWYRDEKLVAYGDTYTYLAWGDTAITSSTEEAEKVPLVVLNKSDDSYMIEYDNAGYEIVDAGIIFGNDAHKEVNSCYYKAKVKDIKAHGQFTAKKSLNTKYDQSVVRGYIIFKDNDESLRVIYAD